MTDIITKGYIFKEDMSLFNGADATGTRKTSTGGTQTLSRIDWVGVDVYGIYGADNGRTSAAINAAVEKIVSTKKATLWISPGTWTLEANVTIPSNLRLKIQDGAVFNGAFTLTINGDFEGCKACFGSTVTVAGLKFVDVDWWGPDGTADETEMQAAYDVVKTNGGTVYFSSNTFTIDTNLDFSDGRLVTFKLSEGFLLDRNTGDETVTFYSPEKIDAAHDQKIFNADLAVFSKKGKVWVEWWGAIGDDSTVNTTAFDAAFDSGMDIDLLGGTYQTAGGHRIATNGQKICGAGREITIIKKSSGTEDLIDTSHAVSFVVFKDVTLDANSLGGSALVWRSHYSNVKNIHLKNQGGTDYALFISGMNLSNFENISTNDGCYGGILIDQSSDAYLPQPSYGALYSTFKNIAIAQTNGGAALNMTGVQPQILNFHSFYCEDTQAAVPSIWIHGSNCANINFYGIQGESVLLSAPFIKIENTSESGYNIRFFGGRISTNVAQTESVVFLDDIDGVSFEKVLFIDPYSNAGRKVFELTDCKNVEISNNTLSFENDFYFIYDNGGNSYVTSRKNATRDYAGHTGAGTNVWDYTSRNIVIEADEFIQTDIDKVPHSTFMGVPSKHTQIESSAISVADDESYDIFGDGGANSPNGNFAGLISISGATFSSTSQNNFALFYAQSSSSSASQQKAEISIGSNVEITVLADDTAAALVSTTDAKLGVQIGGGSAARRFVRVYNRTGATIVIRINVTRFDEAV